MFFQSLGERNFSYPVVELLDVIQIVLSKGKDVEANFIGRFGAHVCFLSVLRGSLLSEDSIIRLID